MRHLRTIVLFSYCFALFVFTATPNLVPATESRLSFNRDIRPILSDNCFSCHGQDEGSREAGLRLDLRESAVKEAKTGKVAIVPGHPESSEVIARITASNPDDIMPPPSTGKTLSPDQIATLKEWISQEAEYQAHWAFIPPVRSEPPKAKQNHPIDRFVAAQLAKQKLSFSPQAERATLLRRLALDLTGIPPSPAELAQFLADKSPDAYDKQVDRLLGSPRYGEKWARHWLDAARFADSDGYEKDLPRSQWPWRDWVINAINRDMPYDQFIIEQLAGDLLPNATLDQEIATGFLRNGMVNEEGAIIAEQFRLEGVFDRMDCVGKAVLGITLQCAQCHTHKFDPITHEEYYRLFAFINNDYEKISWVYSPEQLNAIIEIESKTRQQEQEAKAKFPDWQKRLAEWEETTKTNLVPWIPLDASEYEVVGGIAHPEKLPDKSILTLGYRLPNGELYVIVTNAPRDIRGLRMDALTHGDLPFGGPGRSPKGTFAVADLIVEVADEGTSNWKALQLTNAVAEFAQDEQPLGAPFTRPNIHRILGPAHFMIDGKDETAWGSDRGPGLRHQNVSWAAEFSSTNTWPTNAYKLKITFKFRHGGADSHGTQNNFLGRFQLSISQDPNPVREILPVTIRRILQLPPSRRSPTQQGQLFSFWRTTVPELKEFNEEIVNTWKKFPEGNSVLNLAQRDPEFAKQTFILDRGDWQKPTKEVTPATPAFLHPFPSGAPLNRLGLAQWLVNTNSPTTARTYVNRVWQAIFGVGLLETAEDFGVRASLPTHPELLDWLAVEFMEPSHSVAPGTARWSTKQLIRTIVTSETYKQSSAVNPKLLELDPRNRLLSRGPRFRAEAEVVRDIALAASGLLNEKIGGPSIFPPVPDSFFAQSFVKVDFWHTATGPERYRRSLYSFRRRSMPDPALGSFDAPNGDFACVRRVTSNTPLAALTSLNEPIFNEAAQALALRTLKEGGETDIQRAHYAFALCTGRTPRKDEVSAILQLLKSRHQKIAEGWLAPKEIVLDTPEKFKQLPPGITPTQAAAWTIVARVLLNLDETISQN